MKACISFALALLLSQNSFAASSVSVQKYFLAFSSTAKKGIVETLDEKGVAFFSICNLDDKLFSMNLGTAVATLNSSDPADQSLFKCYQATAPIFLGQDAEAQAFQDAFLKAFQDNVQKSDPTGEHYFGNQSFKERLGTGIAVSLAALSSFSFFSTLKAQVTMLDAGVLAEESTIRTARIGNIATQVLAWGFMAVGAYVTWNVFFEDDSLENKWNQTVLEVAKEISVSNPAAASPVTEGAPLIKNSDVDSSDFDLLLQIMIESLTEAALNTQLSA